MGTQTKTLLIWQKSWAIYLPIPELEFILESPNIAKLTSMHFYAWSQGLKTGIYYLRSRPSSKAIQFLGWSEGHTRARNL